MFCLNCYLIFNLIFFVWHKFSLFCLKCCRVSREATILLNLAATFVSSLKYSVFCPDIFSFLFFTLCWFSSKSINIAKSKTNRKNRKGKDQHFLIRRVFAPFVDLTEKTSQPPPFLSLNSLVLVTFFPNLFSYNSWTLYMRYKVKKCTFWKNFVGLLWPIYWLIEVFHKIFSKKLEFKKKIYY